MGFTLTPDEAADMIAADPRNADVIFPYLNGQDLNSSRKHQASRYVINFFDWPEEHAAQYPWPFKRVRELVKPERDRLKGRNPTADDRARRWWRYGRRADALYAAISDLDEVIAITRVSNVVQPSRVPTGQVFSDSLTVFALGGHGDLGLLASSVHGEWARRYASSMRTDVRYTPSDVFETFPLLLGATDLLDAAGETMEKARFSVMMSRNVGLTGAYNLVNDEQVLDADVVSLRGALMELDSMVLAAFGWSGLDPEHGFFDTEQGVRFTMHPVVTVEVLDRLLELNHERYAAEVVAGLHSGNRGRGRRAAKKAVQSVGGEADATLFD
jgi:hypothetical protein